MNLNLTGHHIDITPAIRDYVTSKIERITRHFDQVIDVSVILSVQKLKQKAEANVHVSGKDIFCETDHETCTPPSTRLSTSSTVRFSSTRARTSSVATDLP
jgi:ribosomal subunit interface protein